ncbi:MAG: alpha/beta fold hydrolase [Flavisolibacter sp.]|nr:alpha/beta fold hydrolase [Flavisolibacter sp.]
MFVISILLINLFSTSSAVNAQAFKNLQTQQKPLVLKAQGSFYVGGENVEQSRVELGSFSPAGHITINQMYVRYMIPQGGERNVPVVLIHGMALTGKSWETTPDGRMGWDEYFVRKGHAVYVPDQVGRGRSGFNQAVFNNIRTGVDTPSSKQPPMLRFSYENGWPNFRFGTNENSPYPNNLFPVEALDELSKQGVPDLSYSLPTPNPTYKALAELAGEVKRAVLISHSQSGSFPLDAALINPAGIAAMVLVEPGFLPTYTDQQIASLAKLPVLVIFGDHLEVETGIPGHSWQTAFERYNAFIQRLNAAGGHAKMLYLPDQGIQGNSHMIMQDKNNLQIADIILKWMGENVKKK